MTDDMQDMLAALEMPSSNGGYVRPSTSNTYASANDQIESIEDFLSNIMTEHAQPTTESQRAPSAYQARAGASTYQQPNYQQPDYSRAPSSYQPPVGRGAPVATGYRGATPSPQPHYQQQPSYAQPTGPAYDPYSQQGSTEGDNTLTQQGFQRHNNRGKWIKAGQGKASDFRIRGTTSSKEGLTHAITVRPLDDYGNPAPLDLPFDVIGVILTHRQTGLNIQPWMRDNGDATYDIAFFCSQAGTVRMEIKICNHPMFDIDIQVDGSETSLWVAQPRLPAEIGRPFVVDIVSADGSRPDGVAPFEVKAMGDCTELKLLNNGDGTYMFTCVPQSAGHLTIQITLHDQPIQDSPVSVQVGAKQTHYVRQVAEPPSYGNSGSGGHAAAPAPGGPNYARSSYYGGAAPAPTPAYNDTYGAPAPGYGSYDQGGYGYPSDHGAYHDAQGADYGYDTTYGQSGDRREVTNDDLNRLLDELGSGL